MIISEKLKELRTEMADYEKSAEHYKKAYKLALRRINELRARILDIEDVHNTAECPICLGRLCFPSENL